MICPKCKTNNAIKDQQGYFKIIRCLACGFTCWLKHYKNIMKTTRDLQLERLAPNNIFERKNAIELANEFLLFEGMLFDKDGNELETAEQVEKKAIKFLIAEGYKLRD